MGTFPRLFEKLSHRSPRAAAQAAHFLFTHPSPPTIRSAAEKRLARKARAKLAEAAREDLHVRGYRIASYRFAAPLKARKGTVLLVHGWTSAAAFMTAPVDHLLAAGYDVVAFDMPAHGKSSGRRAELMDCVLAMVAVANRHGPIDQVIAHSFGGPVSTLAVASELSPALSSQTRLLFIASPNRLADVTEQFSRAIGLTREAQQIFETKVIEPFGVDVEDMDGNLVLADCSNPLTILHSRDDEEVAYAAAEKFAQIGSHVELYPLDGLGHRRILHAQPSVEAIMDAISP